MSDSVPPSTALVATDLQSQLTAIAASALPSDADDATIKELADILKARDDFHAARQQTLTHFKQAEYFERMASAASHADRSDASSLMSKFTASEKQQSDTLHEQASAHCGASHEKIKNFEKTHPDLKGSVSAAITAYCKDILDARELATNQPIGDAFLLDYLSQDQRDALTGIETFYKGVDGTVAKLQEADKAYAARLEAFDDINSADSDFTTSAERCHELTNLSNVAADYRARLEGLITNGEQALAANSELRELHDVYSWLTTPPTVHTVVAEVPVTMMVPVVFQVVGAYSQTA